MSQFLDGLFWVLLVAGGLFAIVAAVGVLRFPGFFSRLHASTLMDTMAAGLVLGGLGLQVGFTVVAFKLALVFFLLSVTTTSAAHALAKSALADGVFPHMVDPEIVKAGLSEAVHGPLRHPSEHHQGDYHPTDGKSKREVAS